MDEEAIKIIKNKGKKLKICRNSYASFYYAFNYIDNYWK